MLFGYILVLFLISLLTWLIKFRWNRMRLYELMTKIKQPPGHFLIGNAWTYVGTSTHIFLVLIRQLFEYGPNFAVWMGPIPVAVIGKPEDLETIMQSQNCVTKNLPYKFTEPVVGEGVFSAPTHKWRRNRKLIQPTFNSRILEDFVEIFASTSKICVEEILPKYVGRRGVDWYNIMTSLSLDTISQTAMGINTDAQRKELEFSKHLETTMRIVNLRFFNIFYYLDPIFKMTNLHRQLKAACYHIHEFVDKVVIKKQEEFQKKLEANATNGTAIKEEQKRPVFLDMLLDINHRSIRFSDKELRDEVTTFFVGGTDTSAVTICFFLTMMGMHQNIQQQVYEEILGVLGPSRKPQTEDMIRIPLLERCFKETLRLFPPAPWISREVGPQEVTLSEFTLPVGSWILLAIFYTSRSENYWKNPLKFNPDRFLPEEVMKRHPYSFLPFSGGLRGCLGMRYSYMNLKTVLSMILRKYRVFSEYRSIEDIELKNYIVLRPIDGFKFHLEVRE